MTAEGVPAADFVLAPGEVHVWEIDLALDPDERELALLCAEESSRASRFAFERDRRRYAASHATLRQILARYAGREPEALAFVAGSHGKPRLATDGHPFNLSHGGDVALVAIAADVEVGVDVEPIAARSGLKDMTSAVLTADECASLEGLAGESLERAFLTAWTRKEAFLKALGLGLALEPKRVHVGTERARRHVVASAAAGSSGADVVSLDGSPARVAALATVGACREVILRHWTRR